MNYTIYRDNKEILTTEIGGANNLEAPNTDMLNVTFTTYEPIILDKGDSMMYNGKKYNLTQYNSKKNALHNYDYTATFESESYRASDILCLGYDEDNNLSLQVFPINADMNTLLDLLVANLNRVDSGWTKGAYVLGNPEYFEIENESVMSVLAKMSGTFNSPFTIEDKRISFGAIENETNLTFEYGLGKGFTNIQDRTDPNKPIINVLYASGSSDNLPRKYRGRRLMIPPIRNQESIDRYGIMEGSVINDNIKPTTKGKLIQILETKESVLDADVGYITFETDIPKFTENDKGVLNIISGQHNGKSYAINLIGLENESFQRVSVYMKKFKLGVSDYPSTGEEFNITEINMDDVFVQQAEDKLLEFAQDYLKEVSTKLNEIDAECDPLYDFSHLKLNDVIRVYDSDLGIDSKFIVVGITTPLQKFQPMKLKLSMKGRVYSNLSLPSGQNSSIQQGAINNGVQSEIDLIRVSRLEVGGFIIEGDKLVSKNGALEINGADGSFIVNYPNGRKGIYIGLDDEQKPVFIMYNNDGSVMYALTPDGIIYYNRIPESYIDLGIYNTFEYSGTFNEDYLIQVLDSLRTTLLERYDNPNYPADKYWYERTEVKNTPINPTQLYGYNSGRNEESVNNEQYEKYIYPAKNKLGDKIGNGWYCKIFEDKIRYGEFIDGTGYEWSESEYRDKVFIFEKIFGGEIEQTVKRTVRINYRNLADPSNKTPYQIL